MMGLSRIKSCKALSRRIVVIVCPSVFLLLYLMMTDEGGGRPAAVASLSSAEDVSTFNDIIYNRPPVIYNFSVTDLDKRFNFSTGKSDFKGLGLFELTWGLNAKVTVFHL